MKKHLSSVLTLFLICAIVSIALAVGNAVTSPIILERQQAAASGALLEVMPNGGTFEKVDISASGLPASVKEAHKASNGGYVFQVEFAGFNPGNVAMIGVDAEGKVTGTKCITVKDSGGNGKDSANEIPAMDASGYYNGADIGTIDGVDTIGGVTISTKAYRAAVKDALAAATILGGGSYRDPAQILSDNLNTALGTKGVEFDKLQMFETIEGVEAVYGAKDGSGHVVVIGGNFIGVGADGKVVAGVDAETNSINVSEADAKLAQEAADSIKNTTFTDIDLSTYDTLPEGILSAKVSNTGVYVIEIEFEGYKPGNIATITISADGKVIGTKCTTINDTPSYGGAQLPELDNNGHFNGADLGTIDGVDTIAGVTISTTAYREAIKNALAAATILGGGSYLTPEQILNNNLNAALGTEGVEFEKHFFAEVVEGVDTIYVAKNGAGHVAVIGDKYIGIDAEGNFVAGVDAETNVIEISDDEKAVAQLAIATIKATVLTDVDITAFTGVSKRVKSVKVTADGVYVIEVEGAGFGINGESYYNPPPSGEYILVRVSITSDGKIIDCYTVYQSETPNYGGACANEDFYGQFAGKTEENYKDVVIAGATETTHGYQAAIKYAFNAVKIFVGGAN